MTFKQRQFVDEYLRNGGNAAAAAYAAYHVKSRAVAAVVGHQNLRKPHIAEEIRRRIDPEGTSWAETLLSLHEALKAKRENGRPDWSVRLKACEIVLKFSGERK